MNLNDLKRLLNLLGPRGAIAGLRASDVGHEALRELAAKARISAEDASSRDELIERIVDRVSDKPLKPTDELMTMNYEDIMRYFTEVGISNHYLLELMKELNYKVSAEDKKHLRRFVARQISETALFSRVATRGGDQHHN